MRAQFNITFLGELPAGTKVGDELRFDGLFTINSISAPLVDVTSGHRVQFIPGELTVQAFCNETKVEAAP